MSYQIYQVIASKSLEAKKLLCTGSCMALRDFPGLQRSRGEKKDSGILAANEMVAFRRKEQNSS